VSRAALLVPGFGATVHQPLLSRLAERLAEQGIVTRAVALSERGRRPSQGYARELGSLRSALDELRQEMDGFAHALVGRSFGGRMCALLAAADPPDALAIIGHPIAPPGRPRPGDEAALARVRCPTLVVQGERDPLGPLAVLRRIAAANPSLDVIALPGAGHELDAREEDEAVGHVARWLDAVLR
jgi:predicted alpha/beta-hydrolase family hydrolase